ncbi:MAG TPA: hypothetical protein VGR26_01470 [Acidimicrobiales bacterium]|nr:hypothetical protein [Acidimicrobiales bacterium]
MEPRRELSRSEDRLSLLGAVVAGTLSAGLRFAEPGWVAVPVGIAAPVLVGLAFPHARTWQLVAGLVLAPLVVAVTRAELLWLALLTLPIGAGIEFVLVRIGQRLRAPGPTADAEARDRRIRLAIIVTVVLVVFVPGAIANARMTSDADARAEATAVSLRNALDRVEPGNVSPLTYTDALRQHGGPPIRGAQISPRRVRVAVEVSAGWQRRCVRGVREQGSFATVEVLPEGCGNNG